MNPILKYGIDDSGAVLNYCYSFLIASKSDFNSLVAAGREIISCQKNKLEHDFSSIYRNKDTFGEIFIAKYFPADNGLTESITVFGPSDVTFDVMKQLRNEVGGRFGSFRSA